MHACAYCGTGIHNLMSINDGAHVCVSNICRCAYAQMPSRITHTDMSRIAPKRTDSNKDVIVNAIYTLFADMRTLCWCLLVDSLEARAKTS